MCFVVVLEGGEGGRGMQPVRAVAKRPPLQMFKNGQEEKETVPPKVWLVVTMSSLVGIS